jgi:mannonate dehydratase
MSLILAEFLPTKPHRLWALSRQIGVTHAIVKCAPDLTGKPPPYDRDALASIVREFSDAGLTVTGLEGDQFDMSRIKLGLPERDEDIERYQQMLRNMAELGIGLLCYNFMVGVGWFRSGATPVRGGALGTHFRASDAPALTPLGHIPAEKVWDSYTYFLRAVMPVAQKCGVRMGLHPDDPPLPELSGIGRIFGSVDAFDRAYQIFPTPSNAITYCQANFKLMNVDLHQTARHFAERIAFIHVRDVRGNASDFCEIFHDQNDVDQASLFKLYDELMLNCPIRCDHVPTMSGEEYDTDFVPGYGTLGRLFAVGYFKGMLQARRISYR